MKISKSSNVWTFPPSPHILYQSRGFIFQTFCCMYCTLLPDIATRNLFHSLLLSPCQDGKAKVNATQAKEDTDRVWNLAIGLPHSVRFIESLFDVLGLEYFLPFTCRLGHYIILSAPVTVSVGVIGSPLFEAACPLPDCIKSAPATIPLDLHLIVGSMAGLLLWHALSWLFAI